MTRTFALVAISACTLTACSTTAPNLPWVHGLDRVTSSTGITSPRAPDDGDTTPGCGVAASRVIELVADVAPPAGRETIVASYSGGIAIFDREEHLVMESPGYGCAGSADELDVVAFGTAYGQPTLAIAATTGGHRTAETWVSLFRVGRTLEPQFTAIVETRDGDAVERGAIYLVPGGLFYRGPGGLPWLWRLDQSHIYVPVLPETVHDEPPIVSVR